MKLVMKKDGRVMPFEESKLRASILNAFNSIGDVDDYAKTKADNIVAHIQEDPREEITAEELGDIVEKGTHEELLETQGFYAELYNSQFEQVS